jgi:cytochrome c2
MSVTTRRLRFAALALVAALAGCSAPGDGDAAMANALGGDPSRGRDVMRKYGCGSCHMIPGVAGANGLVGPPLAGIASRSYIAGVLPNAPENMRRFLENPKAVDSLLAMPNVGVTPADARHITAYLYTLR